MYRRCLCLLLVAQLLLTQGLLYHGHGPSGAHGGHAGGRPPHVHLDHLPFPPATHRHDHGHGHHHHGGHHHHHEGDVPCDESNEPGNDRDEGCPARDHDDDAIDLPDLAAGGCSSCRPHAPADVLALTAVTAFAPEAPFIPSEFRPHCLAPPFAGLFSCPVYLQTLALLI